MKIRVIEAPEPFEIQKNEITVFLAGGITNCRDWQSEAIQMFKNSERLKNINRDIVLINPRRSNWDMNASVDEAKKQIAWEHEMLSYKSDFRLFWFSNETIQPITLFELGRHSYHTADYYVHPDVYFGLSVGTHPAYQRRFDVVTQLELTQNIEDGFKVHSTLQETVDFMISNLYNVALKISNWRDY